jgi:capsular exopolysaccharide synthesis family protein
MVGVIVGVAHILTLSSTKQYDGTATIVLSERDPIQSFLNPSSNFGSPDPEREVNTKVGLITVEPVAERVRTRLGLDIPVDDLSDKVTTEVQSNSSIVEIVARDPDPERAAAIATAFAEEYAEFRQESARENLNEAAELARSRLEGLDAADRDSPEGRELEASLRQLEIAAAGQTGGVEVVRRAPVPTDPAAPRPVLTAVLALVLGTLFAVGLALLLEFFDRRLKDEEDVDTAFGLPVLVSVPRPQRRASTVIPGSDVMQHEAYSALATNLRFFELGPELEAIMVTSPGPSEGKTSVTLGTARALAALDLRVIAIEADLRQPSFRQYGITGTGGGLSTVLAGVGDFESSLVEVDAATFTVNGSPSRRGRSFMALPAGPIPPNPQALLARPTMTYMLEEARAQADVVLMDLPPIGSVNDPVTLANLVDGVVVVARLNQTTRDAARRALRVLRNTDADLLGVVITNAPLAPHDYYSPGAVEAVSAPARSRARSA